VGICLKGNELGKKYNEAIKNYSDKRKAKGLKVPCLAAVLVGHDGGSIFYVNNQRKKCEKLGVDYRLIQMDTDTSEKKLIEKIEELNNDDNVNGIILQLPLPKHINEKKVTSAIAFSKDVDGQTDINMGRFYKGDKCFIPCTPKGIVELIKSIGEKIEGKNAVVIGRSNIVGKPTAQLLLNENATVTICHSRTQNLKEICSSADILISSIGKPGFVTEDFVKEGAIVIDVGTSSVNGKITGDVCYDDVIGKAAYVTPVPGGVGALTTTMLILNTCEALEGDKII
jgi:methylenetetrahydrofolate dehydrogenase (NADP+)/methenyltetrahydrofolate cyclohydrolase